MTQTVPAAGGVVWRTAGDGPEILAVHRPRYDDWTLPKGKLDSGEHRLAAAVREVFEETGIRGVPQVRLPSVRYLTGVPGVEKTVDFWSMRPAADEGHEPDHEVDALRWIPVPAARTLLTYAHDRGVVAAFAALPTVTGVVVLVRHASAGRRQDWSGPDDERPLDAAGTRDAARAAGLLALFEPAQIRSAPPLRCVETVRPLAAALGLTVEIDARFAEDADVDRAAASLRALAAPGTTSVICSQGGLMRPLLAALRGAVAGESETAKGTAWVLSYGSDHLIAADPLDLRAPAV
jgi:8-oxo-(d)GTP phosphatase